MELPALEITVIKVFFAMILAWDYYELRQIKKLIRHRRLTRFIRRFIKVIGLFLLARVIALMVEIYLGMEVSYLSAALIDVFFIMFGVLIRLKRLQLAKDWLNFRPDTDRIFDDMMDALKLQLEDARNGK